MRKICPHFELLCTWSTCLVNFSSFSFSFVQCITFKHVLYIFTHILYIHNMYYINDPINSMYLENRFQAMNIIFVSVCVCQLNTHEHANFENVAIGITVYHTFTHLQRLSIHSKQSSLFVSVC